MLHTSIYYVHAALKKMDILENLVATFLLALVSLNVLQKVKICHYYKSYHWQPWEGQMHNVKITVL